MSIGARELERWVVDIEEISHSVTKSLHASPTDSEEKPSIFCDYPLLVYFGHSYNYKYFGNSYVHTPGESEETEKYLYVEGKRKTFSGWQFVAFIMDWFGLDIGSYRKYIQEKKHLAVSYYRGNDFYDKSNKGYFPEYLLINSCILLFAILLFQNVRNGIEFFSGKKEKTSDPNDRRSIEFYNLYEYIMKDPMKVKLQMLTMEYQIPWFVIECIYTNYSDLSKLVDTPIDKLALSCFEDLYPRMHKSKMDGGTNILPSGGFKHVLHMFHWSRTPEEKFLVETKLQSIKKMGDYYIPSAMDLQLSEVVFEKHEGGSIDMSYYERRLSGVMQLAPCHIFTYNITLYTELLTFERQYVDCGFPFTAYFACMACMLKREADVRVLRANGVIPSMRSDDKDILGCVQRLKSTIDDNIVMPNQLKILQEKVMEHYQNCFYRVYGEFKRRYCSNPWITISVIAGICLFVLTFIQTILSFIQTILSFIQTKYSVLSYKQQ